MNFADATFVKLADETTRTALFDVTALEQIVGAAYDVETIGPLQGPYSAVFDDFELGYSVPHLATFDGGWAAVGAIERTDAHFRVAGLGNGSAGRVDAVWRGSIVARFATAGEPITAMHTSWPRKDVVDAAAAAASGGTLPGGAAARELARRTAVLAAIRDDLGDPTRFEDEDLDALVSSVGAGSVGELLEDADSDPVSVVQLDFAPPQPVAKTPKALAVAAALVVRDEPLAVADLVHESKQIREQLEPVGLERPTEAGRRLRHPIVVVWIVPATVFDDTDWPGANPAARRAAAGTWLAREGIGLAAV